MIPFKVVGLWNFIGLYQSFSIDFDKINIITSMAIIDHTSTPITLRFIQGTVKIGARIKITPKIGKVINIEPGGNILTSSTITITDD